MKIPSFSGMVFLISASVYAQSNCSNPTVVTVCPSVTLTNETNLGKGDDGTGSCNIAGEDVVYKILAPNGIDKLFVTIQSASVPLLLALEAGSCGTGTCISKSVPAGDTSVTFNVASVTTYYLWVDAPVTATWTISIGGDTGTAWVNIPNTQGFWRPDSGICASPVFSGTKPYMQVKFNGVYKTAPMTLSPLGVAGTMCIVLFFKNPTGIEALKKVKFYFPTTGFSNVTPNPGTLSGFYLPGNWVSRDSSGHKIFDFIDQAGFGKGDFSGTPNTCLRYEFCFTVTPLSNTPSLTNVIVDVWSDGYGAAWSGFIRSGCCPASFANCLGGAGGAVAGTGHHFGFGVNDPGGGLPIRLSDFHAEVLGVPASEKVDVFWTTSTEINNEYFEVEKSKGGIEWTPAIRIEGAGNSTAPVYYQWLDENPYSGTSFYRLRQTDYDATTTVSDPISVKCHGNRTWQVLPNPAAGVIRIVPQFSPDGDVRIRLINMKGEVVYSRQLPGESEYRLDMGSFPEGIYQLLIQVGEETMHLKIIRI